ncbi:MAG: acyl carrier protein [Gammaproteobacteria bacterium]|nr:acyl carrier protein [Gammaproteobacteria bacterium]
MDNRLEPIKAYLDRHFDNPPEHLALESRLDEIGIDSMALLELMMELEDKYDFRLPEDVPTPETVGQLVALVEQYKPSALNE